jgi:predicted DNA-binding antitoxin AbrB/MazE fold protein
LAAKTHRPPFSVSYRCLPVAAFHRGGAGGILCSGRFAFSLGVEIMALTIETVYENGVFKPVQPLPAISEGTRIWLTLHTDAEEDRVRKAYGLIGWTGDAETVRRVALDPEFDILEGPSRLAKYLLTLPFSSMPTSSSITSLLTPALVQSARF